MRTGFKDIHHHLLYGLDDGPKNRAGMYRMLHKAAAEGITEIVVTPHVTPGVHLFDRKQYEKAFDLAEAYCEESGLDIKLHKGAEILYTDQTCRLLVEGKIPTMADTDCVLVEFSPDIRFDKLQEALRRLSSNGYRPIIAHIERYRCLTVWPSRAEGLKKEMDLFFQVNCSTVIEQSGFWERRFLKRMMKQRLIDAVATDAHGTKSRAAKMKKAYRVLQRQYGEEYAQLLLSGWILGE